MNDLTSVIVFPHDEKCPPIRTNVGRAALVARLSPEDVMWGLEVHGKSETDEYTIVESSNWMEGMKK